MKKLLSTLITLVIISSCAQALPLGNPNDAGLLPDGILWEGLESSCCGPCSNPCASWCDSINIKTGFYGDYVFDRVLRTHSVPKTISIPAANTPNPAYDVKMMSSEISTQALYTALNIWDRFEAFGVLGSSDAYIKGPSSAFNLVGVIGAAATTAPNQSINNGTVEIYTKSIFSWGLGLKGVLYKCNNLSLGAEVQYFQAHPEIKDLNVICNYAQFKTTDPLGYFEATTFPLPATAPTQTAKINYSEWQAGLGLTYKIGFFAPYTGIKFSQAKFKMHGLHVKQSGDVPNPVFPATPGAAVNTGNRAFQSVSLKLNNLRSRKVCGFVVGTSLVDLDCIAVTAEARFVDEQAVYVSGIFRF